MYDFVVSILGTLPLELEFCYGLCTILLFIIIVLCVLSPWILILRMCDK